jgi:hypothetical protein
MTLYVPNVDELMCLAEVTIFACTLMTCAISRRSTAGSCNDHHRHFSTEFAFDADGTVVSGCAGFVLERCLAATRKAGALQ